MEDKVILVDANDNPIGVMGKMEAHEKGILHRAISVFVFNDENKLLLQRRSLKKYHSSGLWTNTACTHPFPGESNEKAAIRRLKEEMGITLSNVHKLFDFIYKEQLENGLIEHEFDHVFVAYSNEIPKPNKDEVEDYKYVDLDELLKDIKENPLNYTIWFRLIIDRVIQEYQKI